VQDLLWKVTSCASAYVDHRPVRSAVATSLSDQKDVMYVSLQMSGFRLEPLMALGRRLLEGVVPSGARP
jgi:hypothetical protein